MKFTTLGALQNYFDGVVKTTEDIGLKLAKNGRQLGLGLVSGAQHSLSGGDACMLPAFLVSKTDWAGQIILSHYLNGNGTPLLIVDEQRWTNYMKQSDLKFQATQELGKLLKSRMSTVKVRDILQIQASRFHANIDNGEDMVGYQYLHGSNNEVGDCEVSGSFRVDKIDDKRHFATLKGNVRLRWNDIIDPNPQYKTDSIKSIYAELCTFGVAKPYELHIEWGESHEYFWGFQGSGLILNDVVN